MLILYFVYWNIWEEYCKEEFTICGFSGHLQYYYHHMLYYYHILFKKLSFDRELFFGGQFFWGKFFWLTFFLRGFFPGFFSWWLFFGEHIFGHQKQCTHVINKNKQEGTISCARKSEGYIKFRYFNSRTEQPYCSLKFKRIYSVESLLWKM